MRNPTWKQDPEKRVRKYIDLCYVALDLLEFCMAEQLKPQILKHALATLQFYSNYLHGFLAFNKKALSSKSIALCQEISATASKHNNYHFITEYLNEQS
jgi:hypothetical protein